MTRHWSLLLLVAMIFSMGASYKGCFLDPIEKDFLTTSSTYTFTGTISEFSDAGKWVKNHNGQARLKKNGAYVTGWVDTVSGSYKFENVALSDGVNVFSGDVRFQDTNGVWQTGVIPEVLVEKKTDLSSRGSQKVFLDWSDAGIDELIEEMGEHTLSHAFTAAELDQFSTDVKTKVQNVIATAYNGMSIQFVNAGGADVHTIKFYGDERCDLYGESPGDYKNQNKTQTSSIYIATFHCVVVDDNRLLNQTAAVQADTVAQRVIDLGNFIGRTAAHEMGHSLGLSSESGLHGCEGMHNCEAYDDANPSDRFDDGHYIMDPGPKSSIAARIGQANSTERKTKVSKFNSYNKSYLNIIH